MGIAGRWLAAFLAVVLTACGTSFEELRPDPPDPARAVARSPARIAFVPASPERRPIEVSEAEFRAFMWKTVPLLRFPRRLGARSPRSGLVLVSGEALDPVTQQYVAWCESRGRARDCSGALKNGVLDDDGRYAVAFDIALGSRWDGFTEEMRGLADPAMLRIYLLTAMVFYMGLLAFPGVVTQAFAAAIALVLTAYLGARVFWELIDGWREMTKAVEAATTFEQLYAAGIRFGKVIGANTARLLVMCVAAVISEGGIAARLAELPKAALASAALVRDSGGALSLAEAPNVSGVRVAPAGVTVVLQPSAVAPMAVGAAMTAKLAGGGQSGKGQAPVRKKAPGEWRKVRNPVKGNPGKFQQQVSGHPPDEGYFVGDTEFDGYLEDEDVLLEAKGEGYAKFFEEKVQTKDWYEGARKMLAQARRQLEAADATGSRVRWHFAERKAADVMEEMFRNDPKIKGRIEVVFTPPTY